MIKCTHGIVKDINKSIHIILKVIHDTKYIQKCKRELKNTIVQAEFSSSVHNVQVIVEYELDDLSTEL